MADQTSTDNARLTALQRIVGNSAVTALIHASAPRPASGVDIAALARNPPGGTTALRAGTPEAKARPDGFGFIQGRSQGGAVTGLGEIGGLTLIKLAGSFITPVYSRGARPVRDADNPNLTRWYPSVDPTAVPADVLHECFFPGPGDHDHFGTQRIGSRDWRHVVRVTPNDSTQISQGEQEHLNDAQLAFQLVYLTIANAINEVAALILPARASQQSALAVADAELAARLPQGLTTSPADWPGVLGRLLHASTDRDTRGLHNMSFAPSFRDHTNHLIVHPMDVSGLRLGTPSSQIVHL